MSQSRTRLAIWKSQPPRYSRRPCQVSILESWAGWSGAERQVPNQRAILSGCACRVITDVRVCIQYQDPILLASPAPLTRASPALCLSDGSAYMDTRGRDRATNQVSNWCLNPLSRTAWRWWGARIWLLTTVNRFPSVTALQC